MNLKLCPFCDRKPKIVNNEKDGHYIHCECGLNSPKFSSEKEAIEYWNTRPIESNLEKDYDSVRSKFEISLKELRTHLSDKQKSKFYEKLSGV